jgi:hypothetical protein
MNMLGIPSWDRFSSVLGSVLDYCSSLIGISENNPKYEISEISPISTVSSLSSISANSPTFEMTPIARSDCSLDTRDDVSVLRIRIPMQVYCKICYIDFPMKKRNICARCSKTIIEEGRRRIFQKVW